MKMPSTAHVRPGDARHADAPLLQEILDSLTAPQKWLHPKFLYDARGSALFDRICELPEYYLTRTETEILHARAPDFIRALGPDPVIIEPGSGSSLKTRILFDALEGRATYVPVEISRSHLMQAVRELRSDYPQLEVQPVCADFTQPFSLPAVQWTGRKLVFFPGSTLGNFYRPEAVALLRLLGGLAGPDGLILLGADLRKDPAIIERAYNDAAGLTAAFNRNVLVRLNREFGADFDVRAFEHRAPWVAEECRIEMHLVSRYAQSVHIAGETIRFATGESIWTESCHKYDSAQFAALAADAGLQLRETWTDARQLFSVQVLAGAPAR